MKHDREQMTAKEAARAVGVPYTTFLGWIKQKRVEATEVEESRGKVLLVARAALPALRRLERRGRGRPPKTRDLS